MKSFSRILVANRGEIYIESLKGLGVPNPERFIAPPQTEPSPEEMMAMAELENKRIELEIKAADSGVKRFKDFAAGLKLAAETDELGGNNPLAARELLELLGPLLEAEKVEAENATVTNDGGGVSGLEGRQ